MNPPDDQPERDDAEATAAAGPVSEGPAEQDLEQLADRITRAVWSACIADARLLGATNEPAVRPTNPQLSREHYQASAQAAAPSLSAPHRSVGERILSAARATRGAVGMDTNFGILMLAAPLVHAVLNPIPGGTLRERLTRVLAQLDQNDADLAWQAVCLADPQGAADHPLALSCHAAGLSLRQVMAVEAEHDRIAYQYAHDYADIFAFALPRLRQAKAQWQGQESEWPLNMVFLGLLSRFPDTHIARHHGIDSAESLQEYATGVHQTLWTSAKPAAHRRTMNAFFDDLKRSGVQPRTTADLAVATLLAARLQVWVNPDGHRPSDKDGDSAAADSRPIPLTPRG